MGGLEREFYIAELRMEEAVLSNEASKNRTRALRIRASHVGSCKMLVAA